MDNLEPYKEKFEDWEIIQFAIFCHDMVYDVLRNDNEERSAAWAERVMQSLSIELNRIELKGVNVIYWQQMVTTKVTISIPIFLQMLISAF